MRVLKKLVVVLCLVALMAPAFGCGREGSAEKAGKKIDKTVQDASDAAHDAADRVKKAFE